ncbi:MAG: NAD(P)-dependent oxidoreductase [Candidatus Competibacter sp.]
MRQTDNKKSVLVTGSSGFIGHAITHALEKRGYRIVPFDKLEGYDVLDKSKLGEALKQVDGVIHLGSPSSVLDYFEDQEGFWNTTVVGLMNILELYKGRIVFPSTCTVYGQSLAAKENQRLPEPPNSYAAAKIECERLCFLHNLSGGDVKTVRIFTGYGPEEWIKKYPSPVTLFMKDMCNGTRPVIYGDGLQTKDFVFIDDIVNYLIEALETESQEKIFNIGTGVGSSFLKVIDLINKELGTNTKPIFSKKPQNRRFIQTIVANMDSSEKELKYKPSFSIEHGIKITIKKYLSLLNRFA